MAVRTATPRRRTGTPRPAQQRLATIAAHWVALSGEQQRAWVIVSAQAANSRSPLVPSHDSGYGLFVSTNTLHLEQNEPVQHDAPASYAPPVPLQPVRCNVTVDGSGTHIVLIPNAVYAGDVVLYGSEPVVAGLTVRRPSSYTVLGKLEGIGASENVSKYYLGHFHVPGTSYQISLKLVPVSAGGFRGTPEYVAGFALAPGQALPEEFNPDRKKAAPKPQLEIA